MLNSSVEIRIADLRDIDELERLAAGFRDTLQRTGPDGSSLSRNLRQLLDNGEAEFFLAIDGTGKRIGYIQQRYRFSLWLGGLEGTLEDLFVCPESRKKGKGSDSALSKVGVLVWFYTILRFTPAII